MKIILFSRRQLPHTAGEICQLFEAFRIFGFDYAVNEEFAPLAEELRASAFRRKRSTDNARANSLPIR